MIAVTQTRGVGPGRSYLDKLQGVGKTRTEALRLLRRRLSDAVFAALRTDERQRRPQPNTTEPATRQQLHLAA